MVKKTFKETKEKGSRGNGPDKDPDDDPLPVKNQSIMMHIFRKKEGHMLDNPVHRDMLRNLIRNANNYLGKDVRGNHWYAEILKNGNQLWAWVRNNMIRDGGLNEIPRPFSSRTGLCKDLGL